jgi:hypothetical protein
MLGNKEASSSQNFFCVFGPIKTSLHQWCKSELSFSAAEWLENKRTAEWKAGY